MKYVVFDYAFGRIIYFSDERQAKAYLATTKAELRLSDKDIEMMEVPV